MANMSSRHRFRKEQNRLRRVMRGARKMGIPQPGHSKVYMEENPDLPLSKGYAEHGGRLRVDVAYATAVPLRVIR